MSPGSRTERDSIAPELAKASPRPAKGDGRSSKKNYAERLSRHLATKFASGLRRDFPGILPAADGSGQETRARTAKGVKKLDVNYSTTEIGLGLGLSIKTLNFRDPRTKRYTKNYTRIDNELRAEAKDYHQRQPYAVMVAVVFLPADACDDGTATTASSFGQAVRVLRPRSGRVDPRDEQEIFEGIWIGLYEPEGPRAGAVNFFDVRCAPPKIGPPPREYLLTFSALLHAIRGTYDQRNNPPFEWLEDAR